MSHSATARLFIALDLPTPVYDALAEWARDAARTAGIASARLLDVETMHLTICFLGSRPIAEIAPLEVLVERCAQPLGRCSLGAPLWLPPRRPRALAVEVHDETRTIARLHESVLDELAAQGLHELEAGDGRHARARTLRAHVTVARLRAGATPRRRELPPTPQLSFTPERLTLYRSWLAPSGASYEPLASWTTPPPPEGD